MTKLVATHNGDVSDSTSRHDYLFQGVIATPLGRALLAGRHRYGPGVVTAPGAWRTYGSYALVLITAGSGVYRDTSGFHAEIAPGDAILVFPEIGHRYGPRRRGNRRERWDEIYATFDGPVFDLWRNVGLLDPAHPVRRLGDSGIAVADALAQWARDLDRPAGDADRLVQLTTLLSLLNSVVAVDTISAGQQADNPLARARSLLDTNLSAPLSLSELAQSVGLPYETFRKQFTREFGVSPARYRAARRIDAACQLLRFAPERTNRELASALGFADEFHFSRRFAEITRETPRAFRQRLRAETA